MLTRPRIEPGLVKQFKMSRYFEVTVRRKTLLNRIRDTSALFNVMIETQNGKRPGKHKIVQVCGSFVNGCIGIRNEKYQSKTCAARGKVRYF